MKKHTLLACGPILVFSLSAAAETATVTMNSIDANGVGAAIGTVTLSDTPKGLSIKPALHGLKAGDHGFHVHQNPNLRPGREGWQDGRGARGRWSLRSEGHQEA
jgi:Cu-Zn family superoxide dismutase